MSSKRALNLQSAFGSPRVVNALADVVVQLDRARELATELKNPPPVIVDADAVVNADSKRARVEVTGDNFAPGASMFLAANPDHGGDSEAFLRSLRMGRRRSRQAIDLIESIEPAHVINPGLMYATFAIDAPSAASEQVSQDQLAETVERIFNSRRVYEQAEEAYEEARRDHEDLARSVASKRADLDEVEESLQAEADQSEKKKLTQKAESRRRQLEQEEGRRREARQRLDAASRERDSAYLSHWEAQQLLKGHLGVSHYWVLVRNLDGQEAAAPLEVRYSQ